MRISDWSSDVCSSDLVAVHEAEAALLQARAQVEALKATYAQKQAALRSTQADLTFRQSDYKRIKALQAVGASSKSALDAAKNALDVAASNINSAQHEIGEVRAQLGGDPTIETAQHPAYKAALAALDKRSEERRVGKECVRTCR